MLNVHELERRWLRYKIKSYIPLVLSILAGTSIVALFFVLMPLSTTTEEKTNIVIENISVTPLKEPVAVIAQQEPTRETVNTAVELNVADNTQVRYEAEPDREEQTLVLKPSLRFMDNIEDGLSVYVDEEIAAQGPKPSSLQDETESNLPPVEESVSSIVSTEDTSENKVSIISNKSDSDIKDVIRRFKKNKNPALSLFIAKHYYAAGDYQKSYNYALMTNEIDKNIEESWIVFAKSLVKLGQQELAINTLKSYLKTTKSTAADVLLRKIESGAFK